MARWRWIALGFLGVAFTSDACINGEFTPYIPSCAESRLDMIEQEHLGFDNPHKVGHNQSSEQLMHYWKDNSCNADDLIENLYKSVDQAHVHSLVKINTDQPTPLSLDEASDQYKLNPNLNSGVNYSAALLRNNKADEAITVLKDLNGLYPNEYKIATNMGTAYELIGDNRMALHWIEQGIVLNPKSHQGSEWVHAKILRAKIAAEHDPSWFTRHSVLGLPFRDKGLIVDRLEFPQTNVGSSANLMHMIDHVGLQLRERMPLVPPQDPVVANLLFDLAHLLALQEAYEDGVDILRLSSLYGDPHALESKQFFNALDTQKHFEIEHWISTFTWIFTWVVFCFLVKGLLNLGVLALRHSEDRLFSRIVFYCFSLVVVCASVSYVFQTAFDLAGTYSVLIGHHINVMEAATLGPIFVIVALATAGVWMCILRTERRQISFIWRILFIVVSCIWGFSFIYFNPFYIEMEWDYLTFAFLVSLGPLIFFCIWMETLARKSRLLALTLPLEQTTNGTQ